MPRLAVLSVLSAASSPCPDLNLIHYNKQYALTGKTSPNFIKKSTVPVFFRRH
ncbi:hypothetical protein NEILACOT_03421 [Neisseria lactamica ATCC 23970]|uniref:Uncharacterized protein n=1 Tax=Neisseria lactamica ATCC 23970 TaxID=546265 RepID=D0W7C3_NEILA|nr:hypothetical protein NEILACOT_03421 [Neisseria lactamica ATCC 23970]